MRSEKIAILDEVIGRVKGADYCYIVNYGRATVSRLTKLRGDLLRASSRMMVVKNTLLAKAAESQGWPDISALLTGPTAIVTGSGDAAEVAKLLVAFAKENETAGIKGAALEKALLSAEDVEALSKLPSKDAMRGMLLGTLSAPATDFVRVLSAPLLDLLYAMKAYEDKKKEPAA